MMDFITLVKDSNARKALPGSSSPSLKPDDTYINNANRAKNLASLDTRHHLV